MVLCVFAVWQFLAVPLKKHLAFLRDPAQLDLFSDVETIRRRKHTKSAEGIGKHGNVTIKATDGVAGGVWSLAFARSFLK